MAWKLPSPSVRELIRQGAQIAVNARPEWLDELDRAVLASNPLINDDPDLSAAIRRTNRDNFMHWATANVRNPGAPVPANLGPEPLGIARDLVRRGMDAATLDAYRVGEAVAWRRLMEIAFALSSDPAELHEMLDVCSRSVSAFLDDTLNGIAAQIDLERDELTRGTHAERRETVTLILDGAPITRQRAEARLGYALTGAHTAAVVWSDEPNVDLTRLDRAAEALGQAAGVVRPLSVLASTATRWVWVPGRVDIDIDALAKSVHDVRIAVGSTADGVDGFRRSHFDAITTQQMMARLNSPQRIARFTDIQLVALVTADADRAAEFVKHTLGEFESAASTELWETVRVFIAEQCNATRTAARLYTHRNTLLRRLARADELLPRPLAESSVNVAVALDVLRWRGI